RRDLALAPDPRTGLEMTLLRMLAFRPASAGKETEHPAPPASRPMPTPSVATAPKTAIPEPMPAVVPPPSPVSAEAATSQGMSWAETAGRLTLNGLLRELLNNTALDFINDKSIGLVLDEACAKLLSKEREGALKAALEQHYGRPLQLTIRIGAP